MEETSKTAEKGRLTELDILRGILILFVVLGHSFPDADTGITNAFGKAVYDWLHGFHMFGFFFISGFLAKRSMERGTKEELGKHALQLLVPYFFWSLVSLIMKVFLNSRANHPFELSDSWKILLGISPNGGLWFLYTLFLSYLICWLFSCLKVKPWIMAAVSIVFYGFHYWMPGGILWDLSEYLPGYTLGLCVATYWLGLYRLVKIDRTNQIVLGAVCLGLSVPCYLFIGNGFLTGTFMTVFWLCVSMLLSGVKAGKPLEYLGRHTMGIYLIGYYFKTAVQVLFYGKLPYAAVFVLMFFGGLLPPLVIEPLVNKSRVLSLLCLGKRLPKKQKEEAGHA